MDVTSSVTNRQWRELFLALRDAIEEAKKDPEYRAAQESWEQERKTK